MDTVIEDLAHVFVTKDTVAHIVSPVLPTTMKLDRYVIPKSFVQMTVQIQENVTSSLVHANAMSTVMETIVLKNFVPNLMNIVRLVITTVVLRALKGIMLKEN